MYISLKFRDLLSGFMSISLGVRILIGAVLGALGSSTLIGLIADLGAVNYALAYGARLPTEGVPYLRYAITAVSFFVLLAAFGIFFILNIFLISLIQHFKSMSLIKKMTMKTELSKVPLKWYLIVGVFPAVIVSFGVAQIYIFFVPIKLLSQLGLYLLYFFTTIIILTLARHPCLLKWLILFVFSLVILGFLSLSFTPTYYGQALNFARQGGGIHIELKMACENHKNCVPEVSGNLFLRTTESFFMRDEKTQEIKEIPSRLVESIRYSGEERWGTK